MKSYAHQDLDLKKIKKYAAEFPEAEIAASIDSNVDNIPFVFEPSGLPPRLMFWNAFNGIMSVLDEDPVRSYAQTQYLIRTGAPHFLTFEEIDAYAANNGWPKKQRNES